MKRQAAALLAALACSTGAAGAGVIDIRDCPLDTLVFVDPWAGGSFTVKRVGTNYSWLCQEGFQPPDAMCQGPYGDLVLEGEYRSIANADPEPKTAVYSIIKGVPCCDWNVANGGSAAVGENLTWLEQGKAPLLKELPFLSIESQYGEGFGNPFFAASCTLRG